MKKKMRLRKCDVNEENMFKLILKYGFSIKGGLSKTLTQFNIKQQGNVIEFLKKFCVLLPKTFV